MKRTNLMRRLRGDDAAERDAGLTLTELLVAMGLMGILLATLSTIFISAMRTTGTTQRRLDEITDGKIAMSAMGRAMRTAILPSQLFDTSSTETSAFISATPTSLRFYANVNNPGNTVGPSKVTYAVASGVLTQTLQTPQPFDPDNPVYVYCTPGPGCAVKTTILARGVQTTSAIFRYYDALGSELTGSTLTADQLESVDSVDIIVTVARQGVAGNGSTYVLRVAMPNHDAVQRLNDEESG